MSTVQPYRPIPTREREQGELYSLISPTKCIQLLSLIDTERPDLETRTKDIFVEHNRNKEINIEADGNLKCRNIIVLGKLTISGPEKLPKRTVKPKLDYEKIFSAGTLVLQHIDIISNQREPTPETVYTWPTVKAFQKELQQLFFDWTCMQMETAQNNGRRSLLT